MTRALLIALVICAVCDNLSAPPPPSMHYGGLELHSNPSTSM
jgi:hypothetical protein